MRFLSFFALVAIAEMLTFFWVGSWIGLGWALGLAVATALIGSYLVRRAGISVLSRIQAKWSQGRLPGQELIDGASILVAGAFLISPGFITDTLGFLLLVPFVRGYVYDFMSKRFSSRVSVFTAGQNATDYPGDVIDVEEID